MTTRMLIFAAAALLLFGAFKENNLAASYITIIGAVIVYLLHAIEVKLNKLLDHHNISVLDADIARD